MRKQKRTLWSAVGLSLVIVVAAGAGCSRVARLVLTPLERIDLPVVRNIRLRSSASSREGERIVRRAIIAYGGERNWANLEGYELRMIWKKYDGGRVIENPARVQLKLGVPPQIRIQFEKLNQVHGLGDQGGWVTIRDQPDRNPEFLAQARFTCTILAFFLSLPFNLTDPGVVIQHAETKVYAGTIYDVVTVGFTGAGHPWPDDTMQLWLRQADSRIDRCFFISTAKDSGFDEPPDLLPPHYLLIQWQNHSLEAGVPLPKLWSYHRAEKDGTMKKKLFDIEVESVLSRRSFMPVLFREPKITAPSPKKPGLGADRPSSTPPLGSTP